MRSTKQLADIGQSLWLDNITRGLLNSGGLQRYIDEFSVTGLTSNPSIFDHAIENSTDYDQSIGEKSRAGHSGENLFFELALEDLRMAADLFRPIHDRTDGVDGWVSIEVSPLLADDAEGTIRQVRGLHSQGDRPNLFVKIPGTPAGNQAIEECIFQGLPINVTLLFSRDQYVASAEAFMRGIERRVAAKLNPAVPSVASVFISRWDKAILDVAPRTLWDRLGIAVAQQTYRSYRELLDSARWLRLANFGARPQRLLWASTGTKDPDAPDILYVEALVAPFTINTIPDATLEAFADHGKVGDLLPIDGGGAKSVLDEFAKASIDVAALAGQLQRDGAEAFDRSWKDMLASIEAKRASLAAAK